MTYVVYFHAMSGSNCSEQVRADQYRVDNIPFRCEIELSSSSYELRVNDLFHIKPAFDATSGMASSAFCFFCILWHVVYA